MDVGKYTYQSHGSYGVKGVLWTNPSNNTLSEANIARENGGFQ